MIEPQHKPKEQEVIEEDEGPDCCTSEWFDERFRLGFNVLYPEKSTGNLLWYCPECGRKWEVTGDV